MGRLPLFTELLIRCVLGNWVSGMRDSRKLRGQRERAGSYPGPCFFLASCFEGFCRLEAEIVGGCETFLSDTLRLSVLLILIKDIVVVGAVAPTAETLISAVSSD